MIKNLMANWKTTSAGLLMIAGSAIHTVWMVHTGGANENTWQSLAVAVVGGVGLIAAGDSQPAPPTAPLPPK